MKSVICETPVESEENLLARVMAAADVGDRVYYNMIFRYRACVEIAGRHIEPLL